MQERLVDPEPAKGKERTDTDEDNADYPGDRRIERDIEQPEEGKQDRELGDRQQHEHEPSHHKPVDIVGFPLCSPVRVPWFVGLVRAVDYHEKVNGEEETE